MVKNWFRLFKGSTIDLALEIDEAKPGGVISGSFLVKGGNRRQKLKRLECDLVEQEANQKPLAIAPLTTVLMSDVLEPQEVKEIPFRCQLPDSMNNKARYHLQTKLVFDNDSKCFDHDSIRLR